MKLSIAWIFDHIGADVKKQDIKNIAIKFNQITAEMEDYYPVSFKLDSFVLGKIQSFADDEVIVFIPEKNKQVSLPIRRDIENIPLESLDDMSFLIRANEGFSWALVKDFGLQKEGLMPALSVDGNLLKGQWKSLVESDDIIIEVDNKSLTHRPDMWGHRGFAREIAAFLDLPFLPKEKFLTEYSEAHFDKATKADDSTPFVIENKAPDACRRFSGLYFKSIDNPPSDLIMAMRLLKVGVRPINALVDLTNYVMLDWSQPLHAFDSEKIDNQKVVVRMAKKNEELVLLDDAKLELTDDDLVVADAKKPMALAGVMGGLNDSVTKDTRSIFLESASFDPAIVRKSALRHKVRTEASARFEKTLDPNQITDAIKRFLLLADKIHINFDAASQIAVVGPLAQEDVISVSHEYLESRIGVDLSREDVVNPLEKLGFSVTEKDGDYSIIVPSFRCSKDVKCKEDILEEVVRFYGFNNIKLELPRMLKRPELHQPIYKIRKIKSFLATEANMMEQQNYSFFDEGFLSLIDYKLDDNVAQVLNPVSENYKRLATSLVPGLLKNVVDNYMIQDHLYFFELGRTWKIFKGEPIESKRLSGVFFDKRKSVDFYECKSHIAKLFNFLGLNIEFKKIEKTQEPWQNEYQTAEVFSDGLSVGVVGKVDKSFFTKLDFLPESDAFIFDIFANYLIDTNPEDKKYVPISKYQEIEFDLSFLVPLTVSTKELEGLLKGVDSLVCSVKLIDFFEKEEWKDKKALAFRLRAVSDKKTLDKEEIENIRKKAIEVVEKTGSTLRS